MEIMCRPDGHSENNHQSRHRVAEEDSINLEKVFDIAN